jgi:hypothetical protein
MFNYVAGLQLASDFIHKYVLSAHASVYQAIRMQQTAMQKRAYSFWLNIITDSLGGILVLVRS